MPCTNEAIEVFRNHGMHFAPYKATLCIGAVASGGVLSTSPIESTKELDEKLKQRAEHVYDKVKRTAKEFNVR